MASIFSWVDFSDEDREKMVQIIRQLRQQDTIDELGIGSVDKTRGRFICLI